MTSCQKRRLELWRPETAIASTLLASTSDGLQPNSDDLQPNSNGLGPTCLLDSLQRNEAQVADIESPKVEEFEESKDPQAEAAEADENSIDVI